MPYGPALWGPYLIPQLLRLDFRFLTVVGELFVPLWCGVTAAVDILSMPNPVYSNEGRTLRMEGDVVLEVVFLASSQVQVTRVVSGLGHGLDEAAIQAAKQIHFRPAKRDGLPVDSPARVRIEFRLGK